MTFLTDIPAHAPSLADVYADLVAPFAVDLVEVKPGATTNDKTKALALCYVESRAYQDRLDTVIGPDNWQVSYKALGDRALVCRLQLFGVVKEEIGECSDAKDPNAWTVASAQAFKRACSAFGLGRYLYSLSSIWAEYDADKKRFKDAPGIVARIYREAGLR
jgi:hypothetical protein